MKHILITFILCLVLIHSSKAQPDSIKWDNLSMPHTFYLKIQLDYGNQIKHIDQFFNMDTLFMDFIFTDCAAPSAIYTYDSLVSIPTSLSTPSYDLMVRYAFDSNSVDSNCFIHPRWYDTLFQHFIPVGINDWAYNVSQHLKIWPNPIQDIGYIETTQGEMSKCIKVYNIQGQLVKTIATKTGIQKQEIVLRELKAGIYFIKTDTGMMKVLKE